ncbi:MAG TPA: tetratricopeptide repeat protein [Chthoniobacterales bacterium]|nr:tetratricopeptide repeat protein [Chthoniobacterales bacterium]
MATFFAELKRRNVYKVAAAYTVVGWLIVQVATQVFPFFEIPNWAVRLIVLAIIVGFPLALVIAWAFELTPEGIKRTEEADAAPQTQSRGHAWIFVVLAAGLLSLALFFLGRYTASQQASGSTALAKSIAVLPFENRSEDKANSYLADGIQDEILTRLAKIDDLKVISRTSTQRYKSSPENLSEIAKQLSVAFVLEGSVQKVGDQIRVNVQLINALTDTHVWAEVYDRKLADIFAVQSDIAGQVAKALRVKLSSREQQAVALRPTENPEAYDAFLRGLAIWGGFGLSPEGLQKMTEAYSRAVELDPSFAVAWANLSAVHTLNYATYDPTAVRLAEAKRALDNATKLQPDLGDAWFALGLYRYRALSDYDGALKAFEEAIEHGVNRAMSLEFSGYVKRRQGKWDEALAHHAQSSKLDPRNPIIFAEQAVTYRSLRRFPEAHASLDRALAISPDNQNLLAGKARLNQAEGNFDAAGRLIEWLSVDPGEPEVLQPRFTQLMATGKFPEAVALLQQLLASKEPLPPNLRAVYRTHLGLAKRLAGDTEGGTRDLTQGRDELEALRQQSVGEGYLEDLMMAEAALGNRAAVDQYAAKLQNKIAKDAFGGPTLELDIAIARAQLGQAAEAISILRDLLGKPGDDCITPALLRTDPVWNPIRNDPRFQKLSETQ